MSNTYHDAKRGYRVEIEGAGPLSIRELVTNSSWTPIIMDWTFKNRHGEDVPKGDVDGLTLEQYDWLKQQIIKAARDEILDPEA